MFDFVFVNMLPTLFYIFAISFVVGHYKLILEKQTPIINGVKTGWIIFGLTWVLQLVLLTTTYSK